MGILPPKGQQVEVQHGADTMAAKRPLSSLEEEEVEEQGIPQDTPSGGEDTPSCGEDTPSEEEWEEGEEEEMADRIPMGPPLPMEPAKGGLYKGELITLCNLVESVGHNGSQGAVVRWSAPQGRYHVVLIGVSHLLAVEPCKLRRSESLLSEAHATEPPCDAFDASDASARPSAASAAPIAVPAAPPAGVSTAGASAGAFDAAAADDNVSSVDAEATKLNALQNMLNVEHVSLLDSLAPVVDEEITSTSTICHNKSPEIMWGTQFDDEEIEIANVQEVDCMSWESKELWHGGKRESGLLPSARPPPLPLSSELALLL